MPADPADAYRRRPWLASYPLSVPSRVDVPDVPLPRLLDEAADRHPDRVALAFLGADLTYAELRRQVDALAGALPGLGLGRGDRVAVVLPDCPQLVVTVLAALRLGAVVVPHDPLCSAPELGRRLGESGATVAVCLDRAHAALAATRGATALRHLVVTSLADHLPRRARLALRVPIARARRARVPLPAPVPEGPRVSRFADLLRHRPVARDEVELDPAHDVALLAWTGGVTRPARAAVLTHGALVANAVQVRAWLAPAVADPVVVLGALPLWHPSALTLGLTATLLGGGTLLLLPDADPAAVLAAADEHRPSVLPGVPTLFRSLVEHPDAVRYDLSSLRVAVAVGLGLQAGVQERFERLTGGRLVEAYGLAEAGLTHVQPVTGPRRPGTVGLPLPGTRAVVLDPDDPTRPLPVEVPGELAVTGPQLCVGYWRRPGETRDAVTRDGHHLTGDVAAMAADGTFTLLDRVPDLLRLAGRLVAPGRLEEVLAGVPGVADAAVVAAPGDVTRLTAYVVPAPAVGLEAEAVRQAAAARLAVEGVPAAVEVRRALPRTALGAVLRRSLREEQAPAAPAAPAPPDPEAPPGAGPGARGARRPPARRPRPTPRQPRGHSTGEG